jgi:hypothetical protein
LEFLEFVEMIGRVAHLVFLNSEQSDLELGDKIMYGLEEWLALVGKTPHEAQPYEVER